jgi:hypothetical protein
MRPKVMYCLGISVEKLNKTTKILSPYGLCPSLCSKAVRLNGSAALQQLVDCVWIVAVGFVEQGWPSSVRFCGCGVYRTGVAIFYEVLWLWGL